MCNRLLPLTMILKNKTSFIYLFAHINRYVLPNFVIISQLTFVLSTVFRINFDINMNSQNYYSYRTLIGKKNKLYKSLKLVCLSTDKLCSFSINLSQSENFKFLYDLISRLFNLKTKLDFHRFDIWYVLHTLQGFSVGWYIGRFNIDKMDWYLVFDRPYNWG